MRYSITAVQFRHYAENTGKVIIKAFNEGWTYR